jgi:hypothetical protein
VKTKSTASSKTVRLHQLNGNDAWQRYLVTGNGAEEVRPWLEQITGLVRTGGSASLTLSPTADSRRMVYMWLHERPEVGHHDEQTEPARARSG